MGGWIHGARFLTCTLTILDENPTLEVESSIIGNKKITKLYLGCVETNPGYELTIWPVAPSECSFPAGILHSEGATGVRIQRVMDPGGATGVRIQKRIRNHSLK